MNFPRLTFPLTADFCSAGYWIGDQGPFKYGAAVVAFFTDGDIAEVPNDGIPLLRELERQLQTFGNPLNPYVREQEADMELLLWPEKMAVNCSMCFAFHSIVDGAMVMAERYVFSSLRDFLYVELGKSIAHGNAPRQCRLCGRWFLHEQGDRTMYCERTAPGEESKTCREAGARAVFEKKIQDEAAWKLYKRAYKKYYARYMKGNMTEDEFKAWGAHAAAQRDTTRLRLEGTRDPEKQAELIQRLKEELNKL